MGKRVKIRQNKKTKGFSLTLPSALAQALDIKKGDFVFWQLHTKDSIILSKEE